MRTLIKIFFSAVGLILLFVLGINLLGTRADIVDGVTGDKIKLIKPGWTLEQVVSTLGRPYKIDASQGLHKIGCPKPKSRLYIDINNSTDIRQVLNAFYNDTNYCCDGNKEDLQTMDITLTYTRPVRLSKYYPMLWVHLDSSFKVYSVYAKQYDGLLGLDDPSIYGMSRAFDTTTKKMKNEIESYIDEPKYNDCFK
jgi:hypothetical protein